MPRCLDWRGLGWCTRGCTVQRAWAGQWAPKSLLHPTGVHTSSWPNSAGSSLATNATVPRRWLLFGRRQKGGVWSSRHAPSGHALHGASNRLLMQRTTPPTKGPSPTTQPVCWCASLWLPHMHDSTHTGEDGEMYLHELFCRAACPGCMLFVSLVGMMCVTCWRGCCRVAIIANS